MSNGILTLSWANIRSALVFAVLTAFAAILVYVIGVGDIFSIEFKPLVNVGIMSLAGGLLSLIKSLFTTNSGNFLGAVGVK